MIKRITTAVIGIVYLIIAVHYGGWFFNLSVMAAALLALYEFYNAFQSKGVNVIKIGYLFALFIFSITIYNLTHLAIICIVLFLIVYYMIFTFSKNHDIIDIFVSFTGIFYPVLPFITLIKLRCSPESESIVYMWLIFILTWSTDTFAFFSGKALGKRKLCPDISPNKTVEGSIGGIIGAVVMGILTGIITNNLFDYNIVWYNYLIIGFLCGIFGQTGDLIASKIKRYCGIKDYGTIFPGHGGILDRFDSIIVSSTLVYFYLVVFVF
ncbi:MAG: phosphatidate cytidylyltransferase [Clostridia bacterium]|nr:phosphatidate cytidylyltransferase [Clostridia bacterium]